jgi:dipeptidyl aminopeptidase/acylaminoacyl peptidase
MTHPDLQKRLQDAELPDEHAAEERGWRVVQAAFDERPARHRRPARLRVAVAVALIAAAVLALPATGAADWLRDLVRPGRDHARPSLSSFPGGGRMLVTSTDGAWVVRPDGSRRLLGDYNEAGWSPQGLFVIATERRRLVALEPGGRVHWTLSRPAPIAHPAWSPTGFRIAYLNGRGPALRMVAGDGTGDHELAAKVADGAPAWKPMAGHVLAYAEPDGRVRTIAADARRTLWRSAPGELPRRLVWSADGRRLLAVAERSVRVLDDRGRLLRTIPTRSISLAASTAAFAGRSHEFALAQAAAAPGQGEVVLLDAERRARPPRRVFVGAGALGDLSWSPDGRWLLIGWPSADQWLFVRSSDARRIEAVSNIGREFSPGAPGSGRPPQVMGWCCVPR